MLGWSISKGKDLHFLFRKTWLYILYIFKSVSLFCSFFGFIYFKNVCDEAAFSTYLGGICSKHTRHFVCFICQYPKAKLPTRGYCYLCVDHFLDGLSWPILNLNLSLSLITLFYCATWQTAYYFCHCWLRQNNKIGGPICDNIQLEKAFLEAGRP